MLKDENELLRAGRLGDAEDDVEPVTPIRPNVAKAVPNSLADAPLLSEFLPDAFDLMFARAEGYAKPIAMPWPMVNEAMGGGLWPGLHVLTGNTGAGKSQFALQLAYRAAKQGTPVLYIGLELGKADLVARLAGLAMAEHDRTSPPWSDLFLGRNPAALKKAYEEHAQELANLPFRLEVASPHGWSADKLHARANALRTAHPETNGPGSLPMLIVLDYLQLVSAEQGARQELRERIGLAAYQGRSIARDLDAAVLMLSSISRNAAREISGNSEDKTPPGQGDPYRMVGLGKESGDIEFAADSVLALCRGEQLKGWSEAHLAVAKCRAGRPSWQRLLFNGGWFIEDTRPRPAPLPSTSESAAPVSFRPEDL